MTPAGAPGERDETPDDGHPRMADAGQLSRVVHKLLASADGHQRWTAQDMDDLACLAVALEELRDAGAETARLVRAGSPDLDEGSVQHAADAVKAHLLGNYLGIPDGLTAALVELFHEALGISPGFVPGPREETEADPLFNEFLDAFEEVVKGGRELEDDRPQGAEEERPRAPPGPGKERRTKAS